MTEGKVEKYKEIKKDFYLDCSLGLGLQYDWSDCVGGSRLTGDLGFSQGLVSYGKLAGIS